MYAHTTVVMQCFWVVHREISHKWQNFSKYTHDPLDDWKNKTNLQLQLYFLKKKKKKKKKVSCK